MFSVLEIGFEKFTQNFNSSSSLDELILAHYSFVSDLKDRIFVDDARFAALESVLASVVIFARQQREICDAISKIALLRRERAVEGEFEFDEDFFDRPVDASPELDTGILSCYLMHLFILQRGRTRGKSLSPQN